MVAIGLLLIIAGWAVQLVEIVRKHERVSPVFAGLYSFGVLLLVIDGYLSGLYLIATLNLVSLLVAGGVLALLAISPHRRP